VRVEWRAISEIGKILLICFSEFLLIEIVIETAKM
jgi:hypothetical protein